MTHYNFLNILIKNEMIKCIAANDNEQYMK